MQCSEIMKTDIECVAPEASIQEAASRMRDQNIGFLPVCSEDLRVLGTITDRDIAIRGVAGNLPNATTVAELMSRDVVCCHSDDDLEQARELMAQHQKSRIMCLDQSGRLEGVISLSDLAQVDVRAGIETLRQVSHREARLNSAGHP